MRFHREFRVTDGDEAVEMPDTGPREEDAVRGWDGGGDAVNKTVIQFRDPQADSDHAVVTRFAGRRGSVGLMSRMDRSDFGV